MDDEIDFRPYLGALMRRWKLLVGLACAVGLAAALVSLLLPRESAATASILIVPSTSQIALDPRFVTRDATLLTNAANQRQALLGLATSTTLEQRVAAEIGQAAGIPAGELAAHISVDTDGDLIQITANAPADADAVALAEAWGRSYERLVAEAYSRDIAGLALLDEQLNAAQERYNTAQQSLEQFLGRSEIVEVQQEIKSVEGLLDGSVESGLALYTDYLSRTRDLELILVDARAVRAQMAEGQADELANRLAVLALRARLSGGAAPVQLQISDADAVALDSETAQADVEGLIVVLEEQRERLGDEAAKLAGALADRDTGIGGLDGPARKRYEEELAALRGRLAQIQGRQQELEQTRDVALSSLEVLQRKRDEQQIAETSPLVSVRYLSATVAPPASALAQVALRGVAGGMVGVFIGIALALWLDVLRPRLRPRAVAPPAERPADKSVAAP